MASLFGVTPADLLRKIVPFSTEGSDFAFSIGDGESDNMSNADALAIIEAQEAMVEGYMRHQYQRLLRRVEGEVAVRFATEGQTTCQATLTPVTSMRVFKNYPRSRAWSDRRPAEAMGAAEYSVNLGTGVVTFAEPLRENDRIWLDYEHTGCGRLLDIRHLVESLAAVEVARRFAFFRDGGNFDRFEAWQTSAAGHLRDLGRTDGAHIPLFDRIELASGETKGLNLGRL